MSVSISIKSTAPAPTEKRIAELETRIGRRIPDAYRAFLLKHNGGRPELCEFEMEGRRKGTTVPGAVKQFLGIDLEEDTLNLSYALEVFGGRVPDWFFPVARDPGGNLIGIASDGPTAGKVYFWDHEYEADDDRPATTENLQQLAQTFDDFLAKLHE